MSRPKAIPGLLRDINERIVLDLIRAGPPISRAQISRVAGISKPTVSLAIRSLLAAGLVRETAHAPGRPSYGAVYFEPVPDAALVLGFDVGARFLRGALADLRGDVRARHDVEVTGADIAGVLDAVVGLQVSLLEVGGVPADVVDGAVVGVPGVVSAESPRLTLPGDIPGLGEVELVGELELRLGLPVTLENDVNLAALGEHWRGVAQGVDDFVFLSVGTGLGAGIVLGGRLHRGRNGAAGELDYVRSGRTDDTDPSAAAISKVAAQLAGKPAGLEPSPDPRAIFAAARTGDALAVEVVEETARRIALHVVPVAAAVDPSLVVLGGGIGANGDLLLQPVRRRLAEWLPFPPRVEVSTLGDGAVLTGALALGVRAAHESVFVRRSRA